MSSKQQQNSSNAQKRRGHHHYNKKRQQQQHQPKRGGPGILLTCETGRERKCQREGLEIIQYYYKKLLASNNDEGPKVIPNNSAAAGSGSVGADDQKVASQDAATKSSWNSSLDDELAQLRSKPNSSNHHTRSDKEDGECPFAVYDTGCRGTVLVLCTLPNCALVQLPTKTTTQSQLEADDKTSNSKKRSMDSKQKEEEGQPNSKHPRTEENDIQETSTGQGEPTITHEASKNDEAAAAAATNAPSAAQPWDPLTLIRHVIHDLKHEPSGTHMVPGSRFVTRMIPLQATCFAALLEITAAVRALLDLVMEALQTKATKSDNNTDQQDDEKAGTNTDQNGTPTTFAIVFKRRLCNNITRDQIIETVVTQVMEATSGSNPWKVHLDNPDYRIHVEICKTTCGVSIMAARGEDADMTTHNFNLAELRSTVAVADQDDDGD